MNAPVRLLGPVLAAAALMPGAAAWTQYEPAGMEYQLMSVKATYNNAKAICAAEGKGASMASPSSIEAGEILFGMASGETYIGLHNHLQGKPKPCRDFAVFKWDSGMPYDGSSDAWASNEPNDLRCKEKCVTIKTYGRNNWYDVKCNKKVDFICQRPLTVEVHELQEVVLSQSGSGKARAMESCVSAQLTSSSCDIETLSVRKNSDKTAYIVAATVREDDPTQTIITKSGATPMQALCIADITTALEVCNPSEADTIVGEIVTFTSCNDNKRNGDETGIDCGGNNCPTECTKGASSGQVNSGGDPHYVAQLEHGINLCFDVHGTPGDILNLVSGKSLLVNSLVVGAKNSVSGTYHGAIGMVSIAPDASGRRDSLTVLADGTVRFNGEQLLESAMMEPTRKVSGAEMMVSVNFGKSVVISFLQSPSVFEIFFMKAAHGDEAHLDLNVAVQQGLNGTQGVIGQFIKAPASVSPKDDATSILTVNGQTVEVVTRQMPQVAGASDECFKYADLQATGILKGSVADYIVDGIYSAPTAFNLFPKSARNAHASEIDAYVRATKAAEQDRLFKTENAMRLAIESMRTEKAGRMSGDSLRNTLIALVNKHLGFTVEELQGISNAELAKRAMVQL